MADFSEVFGSKKTSGTWLTEENTGAEFCIINIGNPRVFEYSYKNNLDIGGTNPDHILKLLCNAIVQDWRGVVIDGEEVPFTPEAAEDMFISYPLIMNWVSNESQRLQLELKEKKDSLKKTLKK